MSDVIGLVICLAAVVAIVITCVLHHEEETVPEHLKDTRRPPQPDVDDPELGMAEDLITLVDEGGIHHEFQVVDVIEVGDHEYALLLPAPGNQVCEDDVLVLRFVDDKFEPIEDEAEFALVLAHLKELNDDVEDYEFHGNVVPEVESTVLRTSWHDAA